VSHDPYAALRFRDYRRLLTGSIIASFASEMQTVAVGWELYGRTDSAVALGWVGLVQFLPVLLLFLPAGHIADHYNRKLLMILAQLGMATASLGLATLSFVEGPVELMYVCLLAAGVARAFANPARWGLVAQSVPLVHLGNAVTWNSSGFQFASVAGPALGGAIIWLADNTFVTSYLLACGCALTCASILATIRPQAPTRPRETVSFRSLLAGVRFVWQTKLILAALTLDLFAVLLGGATALLPIFAKDILHVGPNGLGLLRAAPPLGALLMAGLLAHRPPFRRAGRALLVSVAGFGVATIVFGISENVVLTFAMLGVTGALDNVSVVVRGTLVHSLTPDAMRGRVAAVNSVFIISSNDLGAFESGMTAAWFGMLYAGLGSDVDAETAKKMGAVASVIFGGIGTILVVGWVMATWPQLWRMGPLHRPHNEPEA
jgi:MFS family permease